MHVQLSRDILLVLSPAFRIVFDILGKLPLQMFNK